MRTGIFGSFRYTVHPVHKKTPTYSWGFTILGGEPRAIAGPFYSSPLEVKIRVNSIIPLSLSLLNPYSYLYPYVHLLARSLCPCLVLSVIDQVSAVSGSMNRL